MHEARVVTILWLSVISVACIFDYYLDDHSSSRYRTAMICRVVGNLVVGLLFLLFLAMHPGIHTVSQRLSIVMLLLQGMALFVSAYYIYNNEVVVVVLYVLAILQMNVCTVPQRVIMCYLALIGFLFVEMWRCDLTTAINEGITNLLFVGAFIACNACSQLLDEFMTQVAHYERRRLAQRFEEIKIAKASGNELLNSLLPPHVVGLVREGVTPIAAEHQNVTIIFTDIKGFTAFSSGLLPAELMAFLNAMYSAFDEIILNWGVYKVEIIGDAYFISSGCPVEDPPWRPDEGAMRAVEVALAMLRAMPQVCYDTRVQMRVGLHTGPVVAGVVGKKGPRFHLFGPTVVYAEKMESTGEAGRVHISHTTWETLCMGSHEYDVVERDLRTEGIEQKTYFVNKSNCKAAGKLQRSLIVNRHRRLSKSSAPGSRGPPGIPGVAMAATSTD